MTELKRELKMNSTFYFYYHNLIDKISKPSPNDISEIYANR